MTQYAVYFTPEELKAVRRAIILAEERAERLGKVDNAYDTAYDKVEAGIQRFIADKIANAKEK